MSNSRALTVLSFISGFPVSWLIARWWNTYSGDPWCLHFFPKWADKVILLIVSPLLSQDIGTAAEQMDFVEVWVTVFILTSIFILIILTVLNMHKIEASDINKIT